MRVGRETALIVVDAQRDFVSGSLAVPEAREAIEYIDVLVMKFYHARLTIAYTMCDHPADHCSFKEYGGSWPPHCVKGTLGAMLVARIPEANPFLVLKGGFQDRDAYSGFDANALPDLHRWLQDKQIERVVICGLATDFCVKATALDAKRLGYDTVITVDAIAAVTEEGKQKAYEEFGTNQVRQRTVRWIEVPEITLSSAR